MGSSSVEAGAMWEVSRRWDISMGEAEIFLGRVGYFDRAMVGDGDE